MDDSVLSDFEDEDKEVAPEVLAAPTPLAAAESLKAALVELDVERQARKAAELAKLELNSKFDRLKALTQDVVRQRDEAVRHRDEAFHVKEELGKQLDEALQTKTDAVKQREEMQKQRDETVKARELARSEIEATARLLVTNAEKITASVGGIRSFSGGLPRTTQYSGLAAIAYGFTKRMEEVVDEVVRQRDAALKKRDEFQEQVEEVTRQRDLALRGRDQIHEQLEQRSYSTAIEVSQLEAAVGELRAEVDRRDGEIQQWRALVAEKEGRVKDLETEILEKSGRLTEVTCRLEQAETQVRNARVEVQKQSELNSQSSSDLIAIRKGLLEIARTIHPNEDPMLLQSALDVDDIDIAKVEPLAEDIKELVNKLGSSWKIKNELLQKMATEAATARQSFIEDKHLAAEKLEAVLEEKDNVLRALSELRMTLMQRQLSVEQLESTNDQMKEDHSDKADSSEFQVIALQSELKELKQEKMNFEGTLEKTRAELQDLRTLVTDRAAYIQQLERRGSDLQNEVRGLKEDTFAAEEEVQRWKRTAKEEAALAVALAEAGEKMNAEIAALNQQLSDLKSMLAECSSKLRSKEEMSVAAIHARNTAERALILADEKAAELRERIEEMARQLEESDRNGGKSVGVTSRIAGCLDTCWPWLMGRGRPDGCAEMEQLMEPLV